MNTYIIRRVFFIYNIDVRRSVKWSDGQSKMRDVQLAAVGVSGDAAAEKRWVTQATKKTAGGATCGDGATADVGRGRLKI